MVTGRWPMDARTRRFVVTTFRNNDVAIEANLTQVRSVVPARGGQSHH